MKNEIINIHTNTKILFDNLIRRNHYLSNYEINYISGLDTYLQSNNVKNIQQFDYF